MKKEFIERIKKTILQNGLITPGDSVLVAVSGGADSVCLLDVLHALKEEFSLSLFAAHLNHMLRGKEADRDEAFVRGLCAQYGIPFHSERVDVSHMAKTNKMTCEEAGRKARYDFFLRLKTKYKINKIATAHNKNDNVETVCMRFLRGTGIDGLAGIPIINDLNVIRPLLHASRQEIEAYLEERGISYITDSSNLSDDYMRNQIRHHLLPDILEHYNKNFIETLSNNILLYSDAGRLLSKQVEIAFEKLAAKHHYGFRFNLSDLLKNDVYIIKSLIKKSIVELINKDATGKTVQLIYENVVLGDGTSFTVNPFLTIYKKYNQLYFITKKSMPEFSYVNDGSREILISETGDKIKFCEGFGEIPQHGKNNLFIKKSLCKGTPLTVRNRRPGDSIYLGNCGRKLIKNLLIDEKIPVFLRDEIPVLILGNEVVWVCGIRDNPSFRAQTGEAYIKISYLKEKENE